MRWHRTLRGRVTLITSLIVGLILVMAAFTVVALQRSALVDAMDQRLRERAEILSADPDAGVSVRGESFFQVVGRDGEVVFASSNLGDADPIEVAIGPDPSTVQSVPIDDDPYRVLAISGSSGTVIVGENLDPVAEGTAAIVAALGVTVPILTGVLGAIVWIVTGRTLIPVERMRREVEAITATQLDRRVQAGAEDEIGRLASTMNAMLDRLERASERQRRFVADASHEVRIPLTRMRSALELARAGHTDAGEAIASAIEDTEAMEALLEQLLFLARSDEGAEHPSLRPLDLDTVVFTETDRLLDRARVEVDRSQVSGAHVLGDRSLLARAVRNLLDNAERHAEGAVAVSLAEVGEQAVLRVADDGPGVPDGAREVIFERFGRADEARTSELGGTGLGLAIARQIADAHHGTLDLLDSTRGAVFELRIPIVPN